MSEQPLWQESSFFHRETMLAKPLVGCSACLLGEPVRYDGGHKQQSHFEQWLLPWLQLQAICPEVGIGLGVPRPTLKLVDGEFGERVVGVQDTTNDVTDRLFDYADGYARRIGRFWPLTAYIFKARSPSCGVGTAPVNPGETDERTGYGAFAGRFRTIAPWLPLYEEEQLENESECLEMLLLSFICRDILWGSAKAAPDKLSEHYSRLLEIALPANPNSTEALWQAFRAGWASAPDVERRERLESLRAH